MRDGSPATALVARAAAGDQSAWNEIVERYAALVWSICQRYGLGREDVDDIGQTVWLRLIENLGRLREPAALPGWLKTTTQRECLRVLHAAHRHAHAGLPPEETLPSIPTAVIDADVLAAERDAALRAAFAELPRRCRELLSMIVSDPPCRYEDISETLGLPVGSIGPTRARCLDRLRRSPHVRGLADDDTGDQQTGGSANDQRPE